MYKRLHDDLPNSRKLGKVSDLAFRLWTNGVTKADWFGRLSADPEKLKILCFPNRPHRVSEPEIMSALDELANVGRVGLIHLYENEDGRFLVYHQHEKHNPTGGFKNKRHRYPAPPRLCRCIQYAKGERASLCVGREFRFTPSLFARDPLCSYENPSKPLVPSSLDEKKDENATDQCSCSSPLFSSSLRKEGSDGRCGNCGKIVGTSAKTAGAVAEMFTESATRDKVLELVGYFGQFHQYSDQRIVEAVRFLFNAHQTMGGEENVPAGRIMRYAIDETIKHEAKNVDYTSRVLETATMRWRDGVAFKS